MAGFSLKLKYATQWVALVGTTLAVLVGIFSLGVFAQYHFANQQELRSIACVNSFNADLLALQVEAGNAYARYINTKVKLLELRTKSHDSSGQAAERIIAEYKLERLWKQVNELRKKASELVEEFGEEAEKCDRDAEALVRSAS